MKAALQAVDRALKAVGAEIGQFCIPLIGIVIMWGIPAAGMFAVIYPAAWIASLIGGHIVMTLILWFLITLFLSAYVWSPHVYPALEKAVKALIP